MSWAQTAFICCLQMAEREMFDCLSSVRTQRTRCEPNTLFTLVRDACVLVCVCHCARPVSPGWCHVVSTTCPWGDKGKCFSTLLCHLLVQMSLILLTDSSANIVFFDKQVVCDFALIKRSNELNISGNNWTKSTPTWALNH